MSGPFVMNSDFVVSIQGASNQHRQKSSGTNPKQNHTNYAHFVAETESDSDIEIISPRFGMKAKKTDGRSTAESTIRMSVADTPAECVVKTKKCFSGDYCDSRDDEFHSSEVLQNVIPKSCAKLKERKCPQSIKFDDMSDTSEEELEKLSFAIKSRKRPKVADHSSSKRKDLSKGSRKQKKATESCTNGLDFCAGFSGDMTASSKAGVNHRNECRLSNGQDLLVSDTNPAANRNSNDMNNYYLSNMTSAGPKVKLCSDGDDDFVPRKNKNKHASHTRKKHLSATSSTCSLPGANTILSNPTSSHESNSSNINSNCFPDAKPSRKQSTKSTKLKKPKARKILLPDVDSSSDSSDISENELEKLFFGARHQSKSDCNLVHSKRKDGNTLEFRKKPRKSAKTSSTVTDEASPFSGFAHQHMDASSNFSASNHRSSSTSRPSRHGMKLRSPTERLAAFGDLDQAGNQDNCTGLPAFPLETGVWSAASVAERSGAVSPTISTTVSSGLSLPSSEHRGRARAKKTRHDSGSRSQTANSTARRSHSSDDDVIVVATTTQNSQQLAEDEAFARRMQKDLDREYMASMSLTPSFPSDNNPGTVDEEDRGFMQRLNDHEWAIHNAVHFHDNTPSEPAPDNRHHHDVVDNSFLWYLQQNMRADNTEFSDQVAGQSSVAGNMSPVVSRTRRRAPRRGTATTDHHHVDLPFGLERALGELTQWMPTRRRPGRRGTAAAHPPFDLNLSHGNGDHYEELLNILGDGSSVSGLTSEQLIRLPVRTFSKPDQTTGTKSSPAATECTICFCDYSAGDKLKILTCFHDFHVNCIEKWLKSNPTCPICRVKQEV